MKELVLALYAAVALATVMVLTAALVGMFAAVVVLVFRAAT